MAVDEHTSGKLTVRQAAFIGVGAMVGAGIFPLLGAAGEVAGAAVWLSFLIAGAIALPQGSSFARFGARYPSAAGLLITAAVAIVLAAGFDPELDRLHRQRHRPAGVRPGDRGPLPGA